MESFLARVVKVYPTNEKFFDRVKGGIKVYNDNSNFTVEDGRLYGAITYVYQDAIVEDDIAFPFDKNNFTFPIKGETITIIKIAGETFYLPYSNVPYSNYREKASISAISERTSNKFIGDNKTAADARNTVETGGSNTTNTNIKENENKGGYKVNEKIKFLQPRDGDTIISGRGGNTIRFSEFFLTEDGKTSSTGIFIRNKQNPELDSKPIGELIEEDINKDGTSVYITSNKVKVPFKETTKKEKVAFKDFPSSDKLKGDQFYLNSDRVVLSAKASEFIIFGKGNTGVITDGRFTIDADKEIYAHSNKDIILQTNKNIVLNSDASGVIYVGKVGKPGGAGSAVQRMVLSGELIDLMSEMLDAINKMVFATGVGPTGAGPHNSAIFTSIKQRLSKIQSSRNFLSK